MGLREPVAHGGLYVPETETANCGVGFIANLKGIGSNRIVRQGLEILFRLDHRGGVGSDPLTGDGAGIALEIPHNFLGLELAKSGVDLPEFGQYGTGLVFLPANAELRHEIVARIERVVTEQNFRLLRWRKVPCNSAVLGEIARASEPVVQQIFLEPQVAMDNASLERSLYIVRRLIEKSVIGSLVETAKEFHLPSLSSRKIIYKGLLLPGRIIDYYQDLASKEFHSSFAIVHQRFSTNTFPSWNLAQPFRFLAHNGEINTLRGNLNWMRARESILASELFGEDIKKLLPIVPEGLSDSASLDTVLELLYHSGRSLPHSMAMLLPEAWQKHEHMSAEKKAFYRFHSGIMEPWDGPALVVATDGKSICSVLDRNGLRPARWIHTIDDEVILSSEAGVLDIASNRILAKGRLEPGKMLVLDLLRHEIVPDEEIKANLASQQDYPTWVASGMRSLEVPADLFVPQLKGESLVRLQRNCDYTEEVLRVLLAPMASCGKEAIGSMGADTPLAVLSKRRPLLYDYFKQLFAQVTNPPLDAIREELVTSTLCLLGPQSNLLKAGAEHAQLLELQQPVLSNEELHTIVELSDEALKPCKVSILFPCYHIGSMEDISAHFEAALEAFCRQAEQQVDCGYNILVLSDRGTDKANVALPALLAVSALHHHLLRCGKRVKCSIVVESAEPREVHHFALLLAFGASAINPYLALDTVSELFRSGRLDPRVDSYETAQVNYLKASRLGIVKIMSKMGISTLQSYCGAQMFEIVGLDNSLVSKHFTGTASRVGGLGFCEVAKEQLTRHEVAFAESEDVLNLELGGEYQWRREAEHHLNDPLSVAKLQVAVRQNCKTTFSEYSRLVNDQSRQQNNLRGLMEFVEGDTGIALEEVEPAAEIVKRFKTGAMSFGSISIEAHSNLAIAMNRIGGKSNSGEGGEEPARYRGDSEQARFDALKAISPWMRTAIKAGDSARSGIKQVASGRFGVTSEYLVNADELQIKIAQGAKPGEGGQLPGHKVDPWIAKVRHSTPGVGLISPPPHHDIYSIEDLSQLIFDLKNANETARVSVKLVSEVGVGTIAAGVVKAKADVVLISGADGGTGASPLSSIKHAGLPWELGLGEAHQVLLANNLRSRTKLEVDGQLKTGRDVAVACLLGAEEFGFATAPLIASGCVMMRKCHLNTCPVGIATQDPDLREKFPGKPEHVVNFMFFVAEELREIMARLGFRTINEMVGKSERLACKKREDGAEHPQLDLAAIFEKPVVPADYGCFGQQEQDHGLDSVFDKVKIAPLVAKTLETAATVAGSFEIRNTDRAVGTITGSDITRRFGAEGLPEDTVVLHFHGSAGQSFGAFIPCGMTMRIFGEANDYFGKGLSGGKLILTPDSDARFAAAENVIAGNVALYGATSGEVFIEGVVGERFCVRNSGASAVVEGIGEHGCEYMTGGRVVVLGRVGRNFAAGMSGGIAYILDADGDFERRYCNGKMVELSRLSEESEVRELKNLIARHVFHTDSAKGKQILWQFDQYLHQFVKVMPLEFKRVLAEGKSEAGPLRVGNSS